MTTKREYVEALLRDETKDVFVVLDPRGKDVSFPIKQERRVIIKLPLVTQQLTVFGLSGVLVLGTARYYIQVPWHAVQWVGRDWGLKAATGVSWDKEIDGAGKVRRAPVAPRPRAEVSGPRTRGLA